ncbi:MAG: adenine deaminase [Candidatus Gastranaerophilales bacterium]|nr:adenine deaminase [Candidatus Gastranaerophilales bacterium]
MLKEKIIRVAKGEKKADLVIKNAKIINVLSEEIHEDDVAIFGGIIAGVGANYEGETVLDAKGAYLSPGFIDGHVHIESSMLLPKEFAKAVVPSGTTTVITDPHEIANVLGLHGISFMHEATKGLPLSVYTMLPSCVPATPYETSGFDLTPYDLSMLIDSPWVLGLAEMMNVPGVLNMDKDVMAKIKMIQDKNKRIDGHAPYLEDKDLCAYIASGVTSDHECTTPKEAVERIRKGMYLMVREGSAAKDLEALTPVLLSSNTRKCILVTDDRHPEDLSPHINGMVKSIVKSGLNPIKAIQMASLNTAEYFQIPNLGAIAPGYRADLALFDDLENFEPKIVLKDGKIVAEEGKLIFETDTLQTPSIRGSVNVKWIEPEDFKMEAKNKKAKVIKIIKNSLITKSEICNIKTEKGLAQSDTNNDILKIVVIERHRASGNIAKGFVKGFGFKNGAIASTVAHDSHNMIIIGTNDNDMLTAAVELVKSQGGKVVVSEGKVISKLALPIAGIMSDESLEVVLEKSKSLNHAAKSIGCTLPNPFMTMAFLSLSVIPELKITDKGVFDFAKSEFIDIFEVG